MVASQTSDPTPERRRVAVVTDSTTYLPDSLGRAIGGSNRSACTSAGKGTCDRSATTWTSTPSTRDCTTHRSCPPPRSRRWGTSWLAISRLLRAGHDVVSIHIASGLSGTCESAREAARIARRGTAAGQGRGARQPDRRGRPRLSGVCSPRRLAARGATLEQIVAARAAGPRRASTSGSAWTRSSTCAAAGESAPRRRWSAPR